MQFLSGIFLILLSIANAFKPLSLWKHSLKRRSLSDIEDEIIGNSIIKTNKVCLHRDKLLKLYDVTAYEALSDAFVGGTVGVMSVAFLLELRKVDEQTLDGCPYCMGNGEILCGACFGNPLGVQKMDGNNDCSCKTCSGRGLVQCINCKVCNLIMIYTTLTIQPYIRL